MTRTAPQRSSRWAWTILAVALLGTVPIFYSLTQLSGSSDNRADIWLPRDYPATREYDWFLATFGSDEIILVSWDGCTLDDPRLEQFARQADGSAAEGAGRELAACVGRVTTGQRVARQLQEPPSDLTRGQVTQRLRGVLVGPDRETTCAVLTLNERGNRRRAEVVQWVKQVATQQCAVPPNALHLGGDIVLNVGIDAEGDRAVDRWILPSAVITFVLAWICLRSLRLAIMVFLVAQYCSFGLEALVYLTGGSMNLLLTLAPVLVYVLSVSASVHLANYYRDAVAGGAGDRAPFVALQHGWQPCLLSALTTSVGLATLAVSHVLPVRSFGLYGSVGVLGGFGVLVAVLPAAMRCFPERRAKRRAEPRYLNAAATLMIRGRYVILACVLLATGVFAAGVLKLKTEVSPKRFLPPQSAWIRDFEWFQTHIGPLTPLEILVGVPRDTSLSFADRMRMVRDIQREIHGLDHVGGSSSAATFAPSLGEPGRKGIFGHARQVVLDRQLENARDRFLRERYLAEDGDTEWWRITLRIERFRELDVAQFMKTVRARSRPVRETYGASLADTQIKHTGMVPLLFAAQRELLDSLTFSFATAVCLITVVMMITLRQFVAGILVMLPNLFPALIVFGFMGWRGTVVDVGSMMTASIALGIAVDDTLHFLSWYRRSAAAGATRRAAITEAVRRCVPAMVHTTLIAGLGLAVFGLSSFQPVSRFGILMFALLAAALVGDLFLLTGMLASPLGRWFLRKRVEGDASSALHAPHLETQRVAETS